MLFEALLIIGVVYIVLALVLVYLFFRVYRLQRSIFLLGLPVGFLFLAMSYIFLFIHFAYPRVEVLSSSLMWLRVVTQTWGFTLIASSYFLSGRAQKTTKFSFLNISAWSLVSVICVFGLLLVTNPMWLSSVYSLNELFAAVNLALLTYIIFFLVRRLELKNGGVSGLISAPVAFAFMWLGHFSFLIWNFDGGSAALVGSQVAPVLSLVLFTRIYYLASKRCHQPIDS